ncbi:hypothetical protein D8674_017143 [Pyrus ussuriensis x Pyrus communis]|uniref:Uncharacterized protein n=1 Tax=Pyrus ussuriensis x Pyrus communis TaxID=2448454 RepID=A0A5N5HFU6_9ROSA|nr:hypothetical protein D8674_017143 [Pyrus ussuriensis x Pyrus communis]
MGNEMGNNNTSGLRDEENTTVGEVADKPLAETSLANDMKEENGVVPEDEGKDFHENITDLASDDPKRIQDACVDDQTSDRTEQEAIEVNPLDEPLKVQLESNEAGEEDGKMQLNPSINNSGYEKPVEREIEEKDLQGTIEHHFEKQASFNKEEEGTMSTSHDPEPKESTHLELNHHEMATVDADDRTVEDVSGSLEGGSEDSLGSNPDFEVNGHLSDAEALEIVGESVDSNTDPVMEKQRDDLLLEQKASHEQFESFEDKSETTHVGGSLEGGSEDSLGSNPDFEVNGHLSDAEALAIVGESVDSNTGPVMEKQRDDLLLEPKASQEQFESFEEKSETTDGGKVECGFSIFTAIASNGGLSGLGHESHEEFPNEMDLIGNSCSELEQEAFKSPNSHLEAPEPEDKCMIVEEEIILIEKELENGENNHDGNTIQSSGEPVIEPDSFNSTELQSEAAMIVSILKSGERVSVINPLRDRDCRIEETKVDENGNLVVMCVGNQSEDSEYQFSDLEEKVEVFPELVMVPVELTVALCKDDEEEATEKTAVEENGNKTEPLCAIAVDHDQAEALPPQSTDSILNSKQENCGEFFAMKASTVDFNNWIAEALDSMNKLALDMPGQHVIKHTKSSQTEAKAEPETKVAASQSNGQCEKVETSESVSCYFETQENMRRFSTESDADNLNVCAQIQKSPSFSLDLQNEARTEESDSTPLLYHDKAAIEGSTSQGDDVTLGSFIEYTGYDQEVSQYQAMPVEEKVIALEASNSEKSNIPFVGFLKEEEEVRTVVTPQEDDKHSTAENSTKNLLDSHTKEAARAPTTSSKGKAKRRQRSSLFTNCMCCATVTN